MISECDLFCTALFHILFCKFCSCTDSDDTRNIVCTCTAFSLLCTAVDEGTDFNAFADIHHTNTLWSVDLVAACT